MDFYLDFLIGIFDGKDSKLFGNLFSGLNTMGGFKAILNNGHTRSDRA